MTPLRTSLLSALALAITSQVAVAQPATTTPQPGSETQPARGPYGKELSNINGLPVKVGEHNEYYYDHKRFNIATNPVGLVMGFYGLSASAAVNQHLAIRADVSYIAPPDDDDRMFEVSLGAPLYLRHMYQGFFVEPGIALRKTWDDGDYDYGYDDEESTYGPQVLVGWSWLWDSGFNVSAAFGAGRVFDGARRPAAQPHFKVALRGSGNFY